MITLSERIEDDLRNRVIEKIQNNKRRRTVASMIAQAKAEALLVHRHTLKVYFQYLIKEFKKYDKEV